GLLLRRCRARNGRAIELVAFANQLAELHIDVLKAARLYEVLQRVGMQWALMRQVANIGLEERHPARRVDRFEDEGRARPHLVVRGLQKSRQVGGLEMFDHLNGDKAADAAVRLPLEIRQGVT